MLLMNLAVAISSKNEEYASNSTVKKALENLRSAKVDSGRLYNCRHHPDLICLSGSTISAVATQHFLKPGDLVELAAILIFEVKKNNIRLTREEIN
jgi:hypothetical protein